MTPADWPPPAGWALRHGPVVAGAAALAISPGAHALLALGLERRLLSPRREFTAVVLGDPLLAAAVAIGVGLSPRGVSPAARPLATGPAAAVTAAGWLAFGLWQWQAELRGGFYSGAQALAPTKIWHQLGVYPLLGSVACCAIVSGWAAPARVPGGPPAARLAAKAGIALLVAGWAAANYHDRRHPKLGHPPYCWRRLRPADRPWPPDSLTLRAATGPDMTFDE